MALNCKVKLDENSKAKPEEKFKIMLGKFRKKVSDVGVIASWKQKQYYESKGQERRRRRKEAILQRRKENKMRSN